MRGSRCKPLTLRRAFFVLLLAGASTALAAIAQEAAYGTLVLQSPVQAVATINGEGTFLLVPGQDLRWNRIRPGSYRIGVSSGGQQWQREVQVQPGRTETLVAALSSAGSPLAAGAPPPPPVTAAVSADVPPASVPPPPTATLSNPPETVTQQRKEDREEQEAQRRREQDLLRQQREERDAEQREREAQARALREEQRREREMQAEQAKDRKPKRPKVH